MSANEMLDPERLEKERFSTRAQAAQRDDGRERMIAAIEALDLEPIKRALMDRDEGYGWSRTQAERHEREYRRFLMLLVKYPDEVIAPTPEADRFWHGHILDTMRYAADCQTVFGYFLHHTPGCGATPEEDRLLREASANLQRLYFREFGGEGANIGEETGAGSSKETSRPVSVRHRQTAEPSLVR